MRFAVPLLLFLMTNVMPLHAETLLENMTWTELRDAVSAGSTTVIVPVGGTEESGPHMALGKHNARVKVLAQMIAEKLGNTIVAPVIAMCRRATSTRRRSTCAFPARCRFRM